MAKQTTSWRKKGRTTPTVDYDAPTVDYDGGGAVVFTGFIDVKLVTP